MSETIKHTSLSTDSIEKKAETEWVKTTVKIMDVSKEENDQEKAIGLGETLRKKPYIKTTSVGEIQFSKEKNKITSKPFLTRGMNISSVVKAALLKTSLSDVLRKDMTSSEKMQVDKQKKTEQLDSFLDNSGVRYCPTECKVPVNSKKKSPIIAESHHVGAEKTSTPLVVRHEHFSKQAATVPAHNDCITYEPLDVKPDISMIKIEPDIGIGGPLSTKVRKTRKRHFKGATYGLYLTPARRKWKSSKKTSDTNSKDDEMSLASTEIGSCIDSDGSSLFSDFTTSDKSLADDEVCLSSRCSPILLQLDSQQGISGFKDMPLHNENRDQSNHHISNRSIVDKSETNNSKFSTPIQEAKSTNLSQTERSKSLDKCHNNSFFTNHLENNCVQKNEILMINNIKQDIINENDNGCKIIEESISNSCEIRKPHVSARKSAKNYQHNKLVTKTLNVIKLNSDLRDNSCQPSSSTLPDVETTKGFFAEEFDLENGCSLQDSQMKLTIKNIKKELDVNESEGCNIIVEPATSSKKQKSRQSARKSQKSNQYSKLAAKTLDIGENSSQLPICVIENPYDVKMFPQSHDSQAQPSSLYARKFGFRTARKSGKNNTHGKAVGKFPGDLERSCGLKENDILLTVKNIKQEVDDDHVECKTIDEHITDSSKISKYCQSAQKNKQGKFDAKPQDSIELDPSPPDFMGTPYGTVGSIFNANDKQRFSKREKCAVAEKTHASSVISTIATSVKSRQRMKRRFTDDIIDTDVGLLSLASLPPCKKIKQEPRTACKKAKQVPQAHCRKVKQEPYTTCKKTEQEYQVSGKKNKQNKPTSCKKNKQDQQTSSKKDKRDHQMYRKIKPQVQQASGKKNKQKQQMSGKKNKRKQTSGKKIKLEQNNRHKKIKEPQRIHISDIVQTVGDFKEKLNSVPKVKPISRAEFIFNDKKPPVSHCFCLKDPISLDATKDSDVVCQAVDSIDDKLVGCGQPVSHYCLVRPSSRIPYTIMCDMHIWRLRNHYCCTRCGRFCSQGTFVRCKGLSESDKVHHLFHRNCVFKVWNIPCCPHCGKETNLNNIDLDLTLNLAAATITYPGFYTAKPLGRRTFSTRSKGSTVQLGSGSVLSCYGLFFPKDIRNLENMLKKLTTIKNIEIPTYPVHEFYSAVIEGYTFKVILMLYKGVYVNSKFPEHQNETALHAAAKIGRVMEAHLLVQAGCEIDALNDDLQTPVMVGTQSNNVDVVLYLVSRKADVDIRGECGSTCLHLAAKVGNFDMCTALLTSLKIDVNLQDDGGWTPIVWASELAHFKTVELLLQNGADPNIRDKEGNTALHWAAYNGNQDICEICIKYGCSVNEVNLLGDTPLHVAARRDKSSAVNCLLIANAALEIKNQANLTPLDCCISDSKCSQAIKARAMILALSKNAKEEISPGMERMVVSDISFGKEKFPIQCVNWLNLEKLDKDFLYITENCETSPVGIDRSITSLQCCSCENDCGSLTCSCGNASSKCWYDKDSLLVANFNMIDPPLVFECNRACMCDVSRCRNRVVQKGLTYRLQLFRTAKKGWGVRTLKDIPKGAFICEYVGELISISEADERENDSYLFGLNNRDGGRYCLDARHFGNISRFINHLCDPNLVPVKVFVDHQDLGFPRVAFFSARDIAQYEELGFDYGDKFWVMKSKGNTDYGYCHCGSPDCKYSSETLKETLASYSENSDDPIGALNQG